MKWVTVEEKQTLRWLFSPLFPLSCRLSHVQNSAQGLHIPVATYNSGISWRSGLCLIHSSSQIPTTQSYPAPFSLLACHPKHFFLKQFFTVSVHSFIAYQGTTSILFYIYSLRNPIILYFLHVSEPTSLLILSNLCHSIQLPYPFGTLSILLLVIT